MLQQTAQNSTWCSIKMLLEMFLIIVCANGYCQWEGHDDDDDDDDREIYHDTEHRCYSLQRYLLFHFSQVFH